MMGSNYKLKLYIDEIPIAKIKSDNIKPLENVFKQFKLKINGKMRR
jgi:hypothetical protein